MKTELTLDESTEYAIDNKECIACSNHEFMKHEDPCYQCNERNNKLYFEPDGYLEIAQRISEFDHGII